MSGTSASDGHAASSRAGNLALVLARALLVMTVPFVGGCSAVLTKPQVDAVHRFASVATAYPKLPASVVTAYGDVHASRTMLRASIALPKNAPDSLAQLTESLAVHRKMSASAAKLDAALDVLDKYAAALGTLSSDASLEHLDAAAASLGKGIDAGITAFNANLSAEDKKIPTFGGSAAEVVRAVGGIVVRNRQAAYLRQFIVQAGPTIQNLATRISVVLKEYFDPSQPAKGLLPDDKKSLGQAFVTYCGFQNGALRASDVEVFYRALEGEDAAEELVTSTLRATERLGSAHKKLVASTSPKADVSTLIDEIKALAKELGAAGKAKDAVGE